MRKLAVLLYALLIAGMLGGSGYALANAEGAGEPIVDVKRVVEEAVAPVEVRACDTMTKASNPVYVNCDAQTNEVSDPRTGTSYTTTATVEVCRREVTGDECTGTTQSVGRTGAEAGPNASTSGTNTPLPQACVGSTCVGGGTIPVPDKVTVFDSGTSPEISAYTAGGSVNANAPQACVSLANNCGGSGSTGTQQASTENVNAGQVLTTN